MRVTWFERILRRFCDRWGHSAYAIVSLTKGYEVLVCATCGEVKDDGSPAADEHAASTGGRWTAERVREELHRGESAHG